MKVNGTFAKIEQGLWVERSIKYHRLSDEEIDYLVNLLVKHFHRCKDDQNLIASILSLFFDNYPEYLQKMGRDEEHSLVATFLKSPNDFYELIFPSIRKNVIRERYFVRFLSPTRARIEIEYLVEKKSMSKEECSYAYLFTPEFHLLMLDVHLNSSKIGLVPHPELKEYMMNKLCEELNDLAIVTQKVFQSITQKPSKPLEIIKAHIQDLLWERRGVTPACVYLNEIKRKEQSDLITLKASYVDGLKGDVKSTGCFFQKLFNLWQEHEVVFPLLPKTENYPIWIFSTAPKEFYIETSLSSKIENTYPEGRLKYRKLFPINVRDPAFSSFRLTECITKNSDKNVVSYDKRGFIVRMLITVPKTLKRWLGFTFWTSLIGTIFPMIVVAVYLLMKSYPIQNLMMESLISYLMQFLKSRYSTIAIFILGLIITARSWLIYEETTFEPLSRKLTILAALLLLTVIVLFII